MADQLLNKIVTTVKEHKCCGCARSFPAGSKMRYTKEADEGRIVSAHWCDTCDDIITELPSYYYEDGIAFGDFIANYPEKFDGVRKK